MRAAVMARGSRTTPLRFFAYATLLLALALPASAAQIDVPGPPGSRTFGWYVTVLPNGNIVIQDPSAGDSFGGAVYLYSPAGTLISTLRGSTSGDDVGYQPIIVLPSGNFLVPNLFWSNGSAQRAGAVTWVDGVNGLDGVVSPANSLVGSSEGDEVGSEIVVLPNGNYVVATETWTNGGAINAGAATFVPADGSVRGAVSATNSLVGVSAYDYVGERIVPLTNGNYLVASPFWSNGGIAFTGAVTWANGQKGIVGTISAQNSLVGSTARDTIGRYDVEVRVWPLSNGNAVVVSPSWDNGAIVDAGAATWIDGTTGLTGPISEANSLVGGSADDRVGEATDVYGFSELPGGRYAVLTPNWSSADADHVGAITWGDIALGIRGVVSSSNSLVGSTQQDLVTARVFALDDGNWVVGSPRWSNGDVAWVGAATWIDAGAPLVGAISTTNSLIGTTAYDEVGQSIAALHDGRYVVVSPAWYNGDAYSAGAATWIDRDGPRTGTVSAANSLVGSSAGDAVGDVVVLSNGNYLVLSPNWSHDGVLYAGAVTWARGDTGIVGPVSTLNSLVGDAERDFVGEEAQPLSNGNAVVSSLAWHGGLGAITWIDGIAGLAGTVSAQNSLVGRALFEGIGVVTVLNGGGNSLVANPDWNTDGSDDMVGAVVWGNGRTGIVGEISAANALVGTEALTEVGNTVTVVANGNAVVTGRDSVTLMRGTSASIGTVSAENSALNPFGHSTSSFDYDAARDRLVVGWFLDDYVSIFQAESLLKNGFD
jgi:hypothetical protein